MFLADVEANEIRTSKRKNIRSFVTSTFFCLCLDKTKWRNEKEEHRTIERYKNKSTGKGKNAATTQRDALRAREAQMESSCERVI